MFERSLSCLGPSGFHKIVYSEWPGPKGARTLVCVHGLTRNGKDFEVIAEALSAHYRVVCPDMPGRGRSDYLTQTAEYGFPLYLADVAALIARLDVESVDWLGTSMGGLIGMTVTICLDKDRFPAFCKRVCLRCKYGRVIRLSPLR